SRGELSAFRKPDTITAFSILITLAFAGLVWCQNSGAAAPKPVPNDPEATLSVELEASRAQLVAGEGLGIIARLKNDSKKTIYITEKSFSLTVPIEMEGKRAGVSGYYAYFPTEFHPSPKPGQPALSPEVFYEGQIRLNPGDSYSVFW